MISLDLSFEGAFFLYQTQGLRLSIVFTIIKKPNVRSEEGKIFKCSLHTNGLELKDKLIFFGKLFSCRVRQSGHLLDLMKKCARYEGLKIWCLYA